ncbi:MAG: AtpZ/AtpI family protein [Caulobacteraceae bacterium]|nr:AtpZ/AtpI family protein [Caulobacteraceae bacterium]
MPQPDDTRTEALKRLDQKLNAFEAKRAGPVTPSGASGSASEGYRLLAGLIGGLLGGLGLGWLFDQLAHTGPIGMIVGLLIGVVASIFSAVHRAGQMSVKAAAQSETVSPAPADDEDE